MAIARDCREVCPADDCREALGRDSRGSPGVFGVEADAGLPLILTSAGFRVFRRGASWPSPVPGLVRLVVPPPTVALLLSVGVAGGISEEPSSIGRGLLAWAMASGPTCCGSAGRPTPANTKPDRTVTGSTFSCILALRVGSPPPKTIFWTLLYTRRHVWKAWEAGWLDKSCRYVWNSQKVSRLCQHQRSQYCAMCIYLPGARHWQILRTGLWGIPPAPSTHCQWRWPDGTAAEGRTQSPHSWSLVTSSRAHSECQRARRSDCPPVSACISLE